MLPGINYRRFIISALIVGAICFISFCFLVFTAHGSFERGTIGHFASWFATTILRLLTIPAVVIMEKSGVSRNGISLFITFAIDCILYGFLIERIITLLRTK